MSLSDIATLASIVSSGAVALSLIYLALQVHQNSKHTRALIQSARVDRLMNQAIGFSDADKCAAYIRGNGGTPSPDAIKERQFFLQCLAQVGVMLDVFTQHRDGLLDDEQFAGVCNAYRIWLREPGFRAVWNTWKATASTGQPKFTAFVDGLISSANPATMATRAPAD